MTESLRVLLVEDVASDAALVGEHLHDAPGVRVELAWARTLDDALGRLRDGALFDCVLLDLSLPDAGGLDALGAFAAHTPEAVVVVVCGVEMEELALEALRHGAQDYVVKGETPGPVLARTLRTAVLRARVAGVASAFAPSGAPRDPAPAAAASPRAPSLAAAPVTGERGEPGEPAPPGDGVARSADGATASPPEPPIRVFLCDDVAGLRQLLRAYLEQEPGIEVVGEAADGAGLATTVREAGADVVLLDLSMPGVDGLEAIAALRASQAGIAIVVLSGFEQGRMEAQALALGADRYLEKRSGMAQVLRTVFEVGAQRRPGARRLGEAS